MGGGKSKQVVPSNIELAETTGKMASSKGKDKEEDVSPVHHAGPVLSGRKCRDVLFLILFVVYWIGMYIVASYGIKKGDPSRLLYPMDTEGKVCGWSKDGEVDYRPYKKIFYPNPTTITVSYCVKDCPDPNWSDVQHAISSVFHSLTWRDFLLLTNGNRSEWMQQLDERGLSDLKVCGPKSSVPCSLKYPTKEILWRCVPYDPTGQALSILTQGTKDVASNMKEPIEVVRNYVMDVFNAWSVEVLVGVLGAFLLGFVWLYVLRLFAGFMVWTIVLLVQLALLGITLIFSLKAGLLGGEQLQNLGLYAEIPAELNPVSDYKDILKYAAYVSMAATIVYFLILLVMIKRIRIAIGIIKEASDAVRWMPLVILFPVIPFLLLILLWLYWLVVLLFIMSAGEYSEEQGWVWDERIKKALIYHVFGLLWTNNFIFALGYTSIAGAVASYYFTKDKNEDLPWFPVGRAFFRTLFYSTGSLAFGAFILALVQMVRLILYYFQRKAKKANNRVMVFVLGCLQYCVKCFERFIKQLTKRAYVMIAIYGYSFCKAARRGQELLFKNLLRVAAVNLVGDLVMWLGKLAISTSCGLICHVWLASDPQYQTGEKRINTPLLPVILVAMVAYMVASGFMAVYEVAIDTILLCFCEDCDRNDGSAEKPYFASMNLIKFLDNSAEQLKREKEERKARKERKRQQKGKKGKVHASSGAADYNAPGELPRESA